MTFKPLSDLPPLYSQRSLIGPVTFWPPAKDTVPNFFKRICEISDQKCELAVQELKENSDCISDLALKLFFKSGFVMKNVSPQSALCALPEVEQKKTVLLMTHCKSVHEL